MDFSRVTAMSYGGRSVSSVWLKGVKVWPTEESSEGIPIYVSDGNYTCAGYCNNPILQWSVSYYNTEIQGTQYLSECVVYNGTEIHTGYVGNNFSCAWGSDPGFNIFYLPYSMAGQTVTFDYSFDCHIDTYSPYYGSVDVYVPSDATQVIVQLPNLSGST